VAALFLVFCMSDEAESETKAIGVYPGDTNPAAIHLVGTIITWWARIEGMMVLDIMALRTQPFSSGIAAKEDFPKKGKNIIAHWRKLLANGYGGDPVKISNIDAVCRISRELIEHRNHLVHSFWPYGQNDKEVVELQWVMPDKQAQYGARMGVYRKTISELNDINNSLARLYTQVMVISFNWHTLYNSPH
jgi:hypothetical protein